MANITYKPLSSIDLRDIEAAGVLCTDAEQLHNVLKEILGEFGPSSPETWFQICKLILTPGFPFALHQMMYYGCFKGYGPDPPVWSPEPKTSYSTNVGKFLEKNGKALLGSKYKDPLSSFSLLMKFSNSHPEEFWKAVFSEMGIVFSVPPQCMFREHQNEEVSTLNPGGDWLPGSYFNPAANCFIVNHKRSLDDIAIRWRDEGSDHLPLKSMTFKELRDEVWLVSYAIDALGLEKGSAIAIDMPMHTLVVIIYLAIVFAGYVIVSIADSFAPPEISTRLRVSNAKAIFTQDSIIRGGKSIPLYSRVVEAGGPLAIVVPAEGSKLSAELRNYDLSWNDFIDNVKTLRGREYIAVERPIKEFTNILFSSGTTGDPKAIPWNLSTPIKAAADGWCHLDIRKGDVVAWPTNVGWMMGPWVIYASLLNGASLALFNGSPLVPGFAKFIQDAKVTMLGVIPSMVRSWKSKNITAGYDWSSVRCFGSTGEASNADENLWLMGRASYKPVIEYCGGTEIGGAFVTGSLLQPQSLCAFSTPAIGCSLFIIGENGQPLPTNKPGVGELALWPVLFGSSSALLNGDHFHVYFHGMPYFQGKSLRRHGDLMELSSSGYYHALGRADDTMNIGGIKVSSVEIERVCNASHGDVLETAAVGASEARGGVTELVMFVVMRSDSMADVDRLKEALNGALREKLNPLFRVSRVVIVDSLPRTATNKVMRRLLRNRI